jgi:hypothetical protein
MCGYCGRDPQRRNIEGLGELRRNAPVATVRPVSCIKAREHKECLINDSITAYIVLRSTNTTVFQTLCAISPGQRRLPSTTCVTMTLVHIGQSAILGWLRLC